MLVILNHCLRHGITLRPCLVHYISEPPNFSILHKFSFYMLISKDKLLEFNNIKFHKSLSADTGILEGSNM